MKNLFILLGNLYIWFMVCFSSFFGILWYGKLPKVSMYHWDKNSTIYTTKDIYEDINCQVKTIDDVPTKIKHKIIDNYINSLFKDEVFKNNVASIDIPLFDGKEIIGVRGISYVLNDVKEKQL